MSSTTVTKIVNLGLTAIGAERISSIDGIDAKSVLANELWETVRDNVLADPVANWSVAIRRAELAQLDVENLTPFDYVYQLPVDPRCLRVIGLVDPANDYADIDASQAKYMIEGRSLYYDQDRCAIKYVAQVTDVTQFDPLLVYAMAYAMAGAMAFKLTQSHENEQYAYSLYQAKRMEAAGADASHRWQGYRETTSFRDVAVGNHPTRQRYYE